MHRVKKLLPLLQRSLTGLIKTSHEQQRTERVKEQDPLRLQWIREKQSRLDKDLHFFTLFDKKPSLSAEDRDKEMSDIMSVIESIIHVVRKRCIKVDTEIDPEEEDEYEQLIKRLQKQVISGEGADLVLGFFKDIISYFDKGPLFIAYRRMADNLSPLKKYLSAIDFFVNYVSNLVATEQAQKKQKREGLPIDQFDELLEGFELESKCSTLKDQPPKKHVEKFSEIATVSKTIFPSVASVHVDSGEPARFDFDKLRCYVNDLAKSKELNGCLSQAVENCLQPIKPCLYQSTQGREVYDHLLLGIAALEHMAQAICKGRKNFVALGFRSALIHCSFAVEQVLQYDILQKTDVYLNSHNLIYLAEQVEAFTNKSILAKARGFLADVQVQLSFRYPEDYRLYFAQHKNASRAFCLWDALSQSEIQQEDLQQAVCFSFEKYYQTLEFVSGLLGEDIRNSVDFKNHLDAVQRQLHGTLDVLNNNSPISSLVTEKIEILMKMLYLLNDLVHIRDFEEGWLLAAFNNMKCYLQLMKAALNIPQTTFEHSLQRFIRIETLLNVDKLFKHLFRAISILRLGEDNHTHDLKGFFSLIETLSNRDKALLKKINIGITQHYLHKSSHAGLKKEYDDFLQQSFALLSIEPGFHVIAKNGQ